MVSVASVELLHFGNLEFHDVFAFFKSLLNCFVFDLLSVSMVDLLHFLLCGFVLCNWDCVNWVGFCCFIDTW